MPRMVTTDRDHATYGVNPTSNNDYGLIIYNLTDGRYNFWNGTAWKKLASEDDLGGGAYIQNQDAIDQNPGRFRIIGNGNMGSLTVGAAGSIGTDFTVGTAAGIGNIILSDDGAWIGRSAATARIGFNSTTGLIGLNSANVTIDDDKWLGISGTDERIEFDGGSNEINILGASVGIGTSTPSVLSVLDITSTKGVFFPRLDNTAMGLLSPGNNLDHGLWIYNTSINKYMFWNGTAWVAVNSGAGNTLDRAYDEGGAGAGNFIDADVAAKPVVINRTNGTYGLNIFKPSNTPNDLVGIGFNVEASAVFPRSAIIHERTGADGIGNLHFLNRSAVGAGDPTIAADARMTILSTGNVGIGETNPALAKLQVKGSANLLVLQNAAAVTMATVENDGDMVIAGKFTSNGIKETSDGRFKKNINGISNALSTVLNLEGVTYNWRTEEFPERSFTDRMEYGVIAQQIEKFVPELVSTDENGYKSVQYSHMVPLLLEAIKEQQEIINSQSKELGVLKASVEAISEHIKTAQK